MFCVEIPGIAEVCETLIEDIRNNQRERITGEERGRTRRVKWSQFDGAH